MHVGNEAAVLAVDTVGYGLDAAVWQVDRIGAAGGVPGPRLLGIELGAGVGVVNGVVVGVVGRLVVIADRPG